MREHAGPEAALHERSGQQQGGKELAELGLDRIDLAPQAILCVGIEVAPNTAGTGDAEEIAVASHGAVQLLQALPQHAALIRAELE